MRTHLQSDQMRFREHGTILEERRIIPRHHETFVGSLNVADGSRSEVSLPPLEWDWNRIRTPQGIAAVDISSFSKEIETSLGNYYFNQNRNLAIGFVDRIDVYRRTRNYGWRGYLELPLTWVALFSSVALIVVFVRWIRAFIRLRRAWNG